MENEEEEKRELVERLNKLSKFGPFELGFLQADSGVPHEELINNLMVVYHPGISFSEKVSILKSVPFGVEVLLAIAILERE